MYVLVRIVCYAWTTTARFHNLVGACRLCGRPEADQQARYLACPLFRSWCQARAGYHRQREDGEMLQWLTRRVGSPDPEGIVALVAIDIVVSTFDARRRSSSNSGRSLFDARLKEGCLRDTVERRMLSPRSIGEAGSRRREVLGCACDSSRRFPRAGLAGSDTPTALKMSAPFTFVIARKAWKRSRTIGRGLHFGFAGPLHKVCLYVSARVLVHLRIHSSLYI